MIRKHKVLSTLDRLCQSGAPAAPEATGFSAEQVATAAGVTRSNASLELNQLVREHQVIKIPGRPVRFVTQKASGAVAPQIEQCNSDHNSDPFQYLVGAQVSLKQAIEQAKAAILYPPKGLHCLITGPTGTGKTLFAQTMFAFAKVMGRVRPETELTIFNCADYAHNPQLLLSQLFGHVKGAFTGAEQEKTGIIDTANQGILFLDEIHRLPPEGQEMLFYVMDCGRFSRLGENGNSRFCTTLIIGATTENPQSALLHTFRRRFPVMIELPTLRARPLAERAMLLQKIFQDESRRTSRTIDVGSTAIEQLLLYPCPGNIGQLINDIRLLCARSLLAGQDAQTITIHRSLLPPHVRMADIEQSRFFTKELAETNWSFIPYPCLDGWLSGQREIWARLSPALDEDQAILACLKTSIQDLLCTACSVAPGEDARILRRQILRMVEDELFVTAKQIAGIIDHYFSFNPPLYFLLATAVHLHARREEGQYCELQPTAEWHLTAATQSAAKEIREILQRNQTLSVSNTDLRFLLTLALAYQLPQTAPAPGVVLIAHGESTASSMAAVANRIAGRSVIQAINVPDNADTYLEAAISLVCQADAGGGVLLLVDMEPFMYWGEIIARNQNKKIRVIENVSTATAVNAARKVLLPGLGLDDLADMILANMESHFDMTYSPAPEQRRIIAVTCLTGIGSARRLKAMLSDWLGDKQGVEVITANLSSRIRDSNMPLTQLGEANQLLAVVGSINPGLASVPFISLEDIISGSGWKQLEKIVHPHTPSAIHPSRGLEALLQQYLRILPVKRMVTLCGEILDHLRLELCRPILPHEAITLTVHLSCMAERILSGEYVSVPWGAEETRRMHPDIWQIVTQVLTIMESELDLTVPPEEISFIVRFVTE